MEEWLSNGKEFFKTLTPKFSFGVDPQHDFRLSFDWVDLFDSKNKISIEAAAKQIAKADIAGGAVGAVSAWWLNAVPVYGQVSYGAFISGGALAASGHEAVKAFLDWLWP